MSPKRAVPEPEPLWHALADPTRRAILDALRPGPQTTGALARQFPTTRFAVMKHLGVLESAGLVTVERRGNDRFNYLNPVPLQEAYERWVRPLAAPAAAALLRLAEVAEVAEGERSTMPETPYGLDVRAQHRMRADADQTWTALLDLPAWWPRRGEEGARLLFEPRVGGRLATVTGRGLGDGEEGSLWAVVVELRHARELVLDGPMGMPGPVAGRWRIQLEPAGDGATLVTVEHRVLGPVDDEVADCYSTGWHEVLACLDEHLASPG